MKKLIYSIVLIPYLALAQQAPTGFGINGVGANANTFWARGGNTFGTSGNNIFGTMWNSPIYTYTDGINRMTVLGTVTTITNPITSITSTYRRSGFVGLNNLK
jgi:hypothetical protein